MKFLKFKNMAMIGAMSIAGVGLIGVGAHATFTTQTTNSQQISSGNLSVAASAPGATCTAWDAFNSCTTLSLASVNNVGSNFTTGRTDVTFTNEGSVPPGEVSVAWGDTVGATTADTTLASEVYMCQTSDGQVLYNGIVPGSGGYSFAWYPLPNGTSPNQTDEDAFTFYAGTGTSECGGLGVGGTPLVTPATNPAAVAANGLTNLAEGGTITPSFTLSYTDAP